MLLIWSLMALITSCTGQVFRLHFTDYSLIPDDYIMNHVREDVKNFQFSHNKFTKIRRKDFPPGCCKNVVNINFHDNYIQEIEDGVFEHLPNLQSIDLSDNLLRKFPNLKAKRLQNIDLRYNIIEEVNKDAMDHYKQLWHLELRRNKIKYIRARTFEENKELIYLNLNENPLKSIAEYGLPAGIEYLHLDHTQLSELPSEHGIKNLKKLSIKDVPHLFSIPDPRKFQSLEKISVTYSMHCCAFMEMELETAAPDPSMVINTTCNNTVGEFSEMPFETEMELSNSSIYLDVLKYLDSVLGPERNLTNMSFCDYTDEIVEKPRTIKCSPEPDAFNPCQDVMGTTALRIFSWLISIFAVLGNLFQLIILFYSRQELTVYKLLMYNLGFANLMMGMYLLVLCCVDTYTYGKYYNYVQMWQYSGGCQAFGFIAMFATQLSFCSLILITLERFLLIIFALKVGNQMKLSHAKIAVVGVWLYSFIIALLPVTGKVSSYSKIAICLPVDISSKVAFGYIVWLLLAYILAFILIVGCYVTMYFSITNSGTRAGRPGSNHQTIEVQVAQRMAMIIFSNFMCWLPISIAGYVALSGAIGLKIDVAKFLLVFIFPLNACTNPFLYAIFTKIFRGDTLALLSSCGFCRQREEKYRNRAPSNYLKSYRGKQRSETNTRHFMHYQPPAQSSQRFERNIEAQTEFDSPETPIKVMIDPNGSHRHHHFENIREQESKPRSDSTRGLLDDKDARIRSESADTCSTGMSVQSTDSEVYDEFSKMIGSVKTENYLA